MSLLNKLEQRRRISSASRPSSPILHPQTPNSVKSSKSRNTNRLASGGLRSFLGSRRGREPDFDMLTSPSRTTTPYSSPVQISSLVKAFVDSLNSQKVSDFLVWFLYYDVVEIPVSPEAWYHDVDGMDMRGWIALGDFLSKTSQAMNTEYGFDLVVLDSICDRLSLQRSTVHALLIQFADPHKMAYSQTATLLNDASHAGLNKLESLELVQAKLYELNSLATNLKPAEGFKYEAWHAILLERIRGLLHSVVGPRIANIRSNVPPLTATTTDHLPKDVEDSIKLAYLYEAIQLKRTVPLNHYGIFPDPTPQGLISTTPPSSLLDILTMTSPITTEMERVRNHAIYLMSENQNLRAQVSSLQSENKNITEMNGKLLRELGLLGRVTHHASTPTKLQPSSSVPVHEPARHRFLSPTAAITPADSLLVQLGKELILSDNQKHQREHSERLSRKYEAVFSDFDASSSPAIRLSDPKTGHVVDNSASSGSTHDTESER